MTSIYHYNDSDRRCVQQRVVEFRDQTKRYLAGDLSEDAFRPLRLMNGLYIQRHAPMLRVAIPYGILSSRQLHMLAHIARRYDRNYGHFTTRTNIQYNWPALERVPDILADLATVDMHAIQTSGNCIRNITSDALAGISADEQADPRPYCELIRQWANLHPEFAYLPRKFKIAVTGAHHDRAVTAVHDIGLRLYQNAQGADLFAVFVGGGLGRTPRIGKPIRQQLPARDILSYLEAILRIYNLHGRRDNKYKARIKILLLEMGDRDFSAAVEEQWQSLRNGPLRLTESRIAAIKRHFKAPPPRPSSTMATLPQDAAFQRWYRHNSQAHKQVGYRIVSLSLKHPLRPPGDISADQMDRVAELAARYSNSEIRVTKDQNLLLPEVAEQQLLTLWQELSAIHLATPNIGQLTDMICCPGLDLCSLANAATYPIAAQLQEHFHNLQQLYDIGPLRLNLSGCINACGHHHIGHIGILGIDKKGQQYYQISIGGNDSGSTEIGRIIGPALPQQDVCAAIDKLIAVYLAQRQQDEPFIATVRRIGLAPFRQRVYATA